MSLLQKTYTYTLALLIALFPFSKALPNILLPILLVLFVADIKNIRFTELKKPVVISLYAVIVYLFLKGAVRGSLFSEFSVYGKYLVIIFMPILFLKVKDYLLLKKALLFGITATVIVSIIKSLVYYVNYGNFPFGTGLEVNEILVLERPYAGFYAVAGTMLSVHLIKYLPKYKWLLVANAALCTFFIVLVVARMSLLSLIIIGGIYLLFYASLTVLQKTGVVLAGALCMAGALYFSKSMQQRLFVNSTKQTAIDYEPRVVIWDCAYDLLADADYNTLFGFQSNKVLEEKYVACYDTKITGNQSKKDWFLTVKFNSHNQFHDYMLAHGFIGLILLSGFMLMLMYSVRHSFEYFSIAFAFAFFMLVENIFFRQMGCYIFSIFTALLIMNNPRINEQN